MKPPNDIAPGYLRRAAAARYLGIAPRTLTDWQNKRIVPVHHLGRRCVLFRVADLDAAMKRFRVGAIGE